MTTVLNALSPQDWVKLIFALLLFLGPGLGLLSFYSARSRFDGTQTLIIAFCLSVSILANLLPWLQLLHVPVNTTSCFVIFGSGWLIGFIRNRPYGHLTETLRNTIGSPIGILLWGVLILTVMVSLWAIQGIAVASGVDSYHHTLITQMIVERASLPDSYEPYAPLVTFSYHFGFHGTVAALAKLTNIRAISLVPIVGQLLIAASALSVHFFAEQLTGNKRIATLSAAIVGLVAAVPAAYGYWSRYPQLMGLVLVPVLVALVYRWATARFELPLMPFLGILSAGLALTHYRVTLMAAIGIPFLLIAGWPSLLARTTTRREWMGVGGRLLGVAVVAACLTLPWVWHVVAARSQGYPIDALGLSTDGSSFFDLIRLGPWVLGHPSNSTLLMLAGLGVVAALWLHDLRMIALASWAGCLLVLSSPRLLGSNMDTVTVTMSLFVQGSIIVSWVIVSLTHCLSHSKRSLVWLIWFGCVVVTAVGAFANASVIEAGNIFVRQDDMKAIEWIKSNTPDSARFMVNLFHFGFNERSISGSDAGYWLPLLAKRQTVVLPLSFTIERADAPDTMARLIALDRLGGQLATPQSLDILRQNGVTHVFVGARGGPIVIDEMLRSPAFMLEYQSGSAYVFRVTTAP